MTVARLEQEDDEEKSDLCANLILNFIRDYNDKFGPMEGCHWVCGLAKVLPCYYQTSKIPFKQFKSDMNEVIERFKY